MSEASAALSVVRRPALVAALVAATLVVALLAIRVASATPLGGWLAGQVLAERAIGAGLTLRASEVRGDPLRRLEIGVLSVADADGVWLHARDVELAWSPWALARRRIVVRSGGAEALTVVRRPAAAEDASARGEGGGGAGWGVDVRGLAVSELTLEEGVAGGPAAFSLTASGRYLGGALRAAAVDLIRSDRPGDALTLAVTPGADGGLSGSARLRADAGGPLAAVLGAPEHAFDLTVTAQGARAAAQGALELLVDGEQAARIDGGWVDAAATLEGRVDVRRVPQLAPLAARLGGEADLRVETRAGDGGDEIVAQLTTPTVALSAVAPWRGRALADTVGVEARVFDAAAVFGLDAARIEEVTLRGELTAAADARFEGVLSVTEPSAGETAAARIEGPVSVAQEGSAWRVGATLAGDGFASPTPLGPILGPRPIVQLDAVIDTGAEVARIERAAVRGDQLDARAQGRVGLGAGATSLSGEARLASLASLAEGLAGEAELRVSVERPDPGAPFRLVADAGLGGFASDLDALADLVGETASAQAQIAAGPGGVVIEAATFDAARIAAEARGSVGADGALDLSADVGLAGPFAAGAAEADGALALAAVVSGSLAAPQARAEARLDGLVAGPVAVTDVRVRVEGRDLTTAPAGRVRVDAVHADGPATLSATFAHADGRLEVASLVGSWTRFGVRGAGGVGGAGAPTATVMLTDVEDRLGAQVELTDDGARGGLRLEARVRDTPIGSEGWIGEALARVEGPLEELSLSFSAVGDAPAPFALEATGTARLDADGARRIALRPSGAIGGAAFAAQNPFTVTIGPEEARAAGELVIDGGRLALEGRSGPDGAALDLVVEDAPLAVFDIARARSRLDGRASGSIALAGRERVEGAARFEISGARPAGARSALGVNAQAEATLARTGLEVRLVAEDAAGLSLQADGTAPVFLSAAPFGARLAEGPLHARVTSRGPIDGLWALVGEESLEIAGEMDAELLVSGPVAQPRVAGVVALTAGRLTDSLSGLRLRDGEARAAFDGVEARLTDLRAGDGQGGTLEGRGRVLADGEAGPAGDVAIRFQRFRVVDRDDAEAVASGEVTARFADGAVRLEGLVDVERADISPVAAGGGTAPTLIAVEEVNRPRALEPIAPPTAGLPITLALGARADRRVFIRAPGLESEWALDVDIEGEADDPQVFGAATLLRGQYELAGEVFAFDEGVIWFDGPADEARLDLVARRAATDLTAVVRLGGTVTAPTITLESTPSYPQDEILARMLFGRSASELTAFEAAQLAAALAQLARGGQGLVGVVRSELGLDRLRVSSDPETGAVVSGGKYVADGVYLELGAGAQGAAEAAIEWQIRPRLELVSRFGGPREAQLALRWRRDY